MATREVIVELKLGDTQAVARLGQLEIETKAYQRELRALNAEIAKNGQATKAQEIAVGQLNAKIRANQTVVRELKNDLSGATAAGLRFRDKMAEASRAGLAEFGLQAASIAAVGTAVASLTKELFALAGQIELVDARNRAIAQDSLPAFTRAAELSANAIGLTQREYVSLAADQALRLKQLGIEGDLLTELSIQTVEYADKLGDFSGGELSAEQAASLLNDALTGQTKGLKELGVNVKATKEEIAANAQELMRSKGLTEEQATAVATLQLAFRDTGDSVKVFGDQLLNLDAAQDSATARFNEAKEALAVGLTPVFEAATESAAEFADALARLLSSDGFFGKAEGFIDIINKLNPAGWAAGFLGKNVFADTEKGINDLATATAAYNAALLIGNDKLTEKAKANLDAVRALSGETLKAKAVDEDGAKATDAKTLSIGELRDKLKLLKEDQEKLLVTDKAGYDAKQADINAIEKQIAAIEGKTKAVKKLTEAQLAQIDSENAIRGDARTNILAAPTPSGKDPFDPNQETIEERRAAIGMPEEFIEEVTFQYVELDRLQDEFEIQQIQGLVDFNTERALLDAQYGAGKIKSVEEYNARIAAIEQSKVAATISSYEMLVQAGARLGNALAQNSKESYEIQKAFALAQLAIDTAKAISSLTAASAANPTNAVTFGAAGAAQFAAGIIQIIANIAQAAQLLSSGAPAGYEEGGYTAKRSKNTEPVGVVHANEWVAPAWQTQHPDYAPTIKWLEQARKRRGLRSGIDGFFGGGVVNNVRFARGTGLATQTGSGTIAQADLSRALLNMPPPVVSVTEIREVSNRVSVVERMSRA